MTSQRNDRRRGTNRFSFGGDGSSDQDEIKALLESQKTVHDNQPLDFRFDMKPSDVKQYLDRFVIGQDRAKKVLANGVCYHFKRVARELGEERLEYEARQNQETESEPVGQETTNLDQRVISPMTIPETKKNGHIKKNILLVGNTGVGKTYLVSKLSHLIGVPFVKADMTKFSATGYVGGDVEDTVRDLHVKANYDKRVSEIGMVYLDEFDKIASYSMTIGKDVNGLEVQRTLLKLLEETEVDVMSKKSPMAMMGMPMDGQPTKINTKNILFICSGAFPGLESIISPRLAAGQAWRDHITAQDLVAYGMEAELVGRIPIRAALNDLSNDDLYRIMTHSEDSILPKYQQDFAEYGINLKFEDEALHMIADKAALVKTGARALVGTIEDFLLDFMYELPSTPIKELVVTKELIQNPQAYLDKMVTDYVKK